MQSLVPGARNLVPSRPRVPAPSSSSQSRDHAHHNYHAHRHSEAYKALAEFPDQNLGWLSFDGDFFSVRERSPFKNDFPTETLVKPKTYFQMAEQWAIIMATKHLRAARRLNQYVDEYVFEATINRIAKDRDEEFAIFTTRIAKSYAKQVRKDWLYFCEGF